MSTDMAAAGLQSQASEWNETLRAEYLAVFHYWAQGVLAARAGSRHLPEPPHVFVAGFFADSADPMAPSAYPEMGTEPGWAIPAVRPAIRPTPLYIEYCDARVS